jgi:hypothetical protein
MSGFGKKVPVDRRQSVRRPIFTVGSAVTVEGSKSVFVENLSSNGARVRGRDLPPVGKQILIWMDGMDALGSVAWQSFGQCGVAFDVALAASALGGLEEQSVATCRE